MVNSWANYFHQVSWGLDKNCGFFTNGKFFSVSVFLLRPYKVHITHWWKFFISIYLSQKQFIILTDWCNLSISWSRLLKDRSHLSMSYVISEIYLFQKLKLCSHNFNFWIFKNILFSLMILITKLLFIFSWTFQFF